MTANNNTSGEQLQKRRKAAEGTATFGLLLICVALVAPFANWGSVQDLGIYKWIYGAGALIYTAARCVGVNAPGESLRLRRLRRMEFWAGVAFVTGTAFWFYKEEHLGPMAGPLAVLKDTIMFTLAGAAVQIISSWLIVAQSKKENNIR